MITDHSIAAALELRPLPPPWDAAPPLSLELAITDAYQHFNDASPARREAEILRFQLPAMFQPLQPGDPLAGRIRYPLVGLSPELMGIGCYCLEKPIRQILANASSQTIDTTHRRHVEDMLDYWRTRTTHAKIRAAHPEDVRRLLPEDNWPNHPGSAFPLYRIAGITLDYKKLLRNGLPGLIQNIQRQLAAPPGPLPLPHDAHDLLENTCTVLETLLAIIRRHATEARTLARAHPASGAAAIADTLDALTQRPPATLREAIQLAWLASLAAGVVNYGRMDIWLAPFLDHDLDAGLLTPDAALEQLKDFWRHIATTYDNMFNNRIVVGGLGRPDESSSDRFALIAIEATRTVPLNQPQLTLRFHRGQNPALMRAALTSIGEGRTFPLLYNDDANIPAVATAFDLPREEALHYIPYGCGEYIIDHSGTGSPNGLINLLHLLHETLHPPAPPSSPPPLDELYPDFETLWTAYATNVETAVSALSRHQKITHDITANDAPLLLVSHLFDDCAARHAPLHSGGARHPGGTLETYGNINTADSLTAIHHHVYQHKTCTLEELARACDDNFRSTAAARLRRALLAAPKFGNDDDTADAMAIRVHDHICQTTRAQAPRVGLRTYLAVVINNGANTVLGLNTPASPDGRLAGAPMANAINPAPGRDRSGITAFLNSLKKLPAHHHAGAVHNMKFARSLFTPPLLAKTTALLSAWFASGGTQAMITVVNRNDLEAAMREPENWAHLIVRVGGFSARFIDLSPEIQREVLARTLNE
ncbi:pyruvate formate lyase family protein [Geminisphaera colitermitum]|uniref:pyruvate formate lyase family protein n=1 Tax=Geminisphaera colitermitum TaxID=1148786 RepID=UPI00069347CE|nr:pyruvate formate lyase family protein [Geminisphaera colitermitum]